MGMLDSSLLQVVLTPKDACYGAREWPIVGVGGQVATARRTKGVGTVFSGLRHRLPIEVVDGDGSVLCTVRRSRALKGSCNTHRVVDPAGEPIGTLTSRSARGEDGRMQFASQIIDAQDRLIATRPSQPPEDGPHYVSADPRWADVTSETTGARGGWTTTVTRTVRGLDALPEDWRLLLGVMITVRDPWAAGESAASYRSQRQADLTL